MNVVPFYRYSFCPKQASWTPDCLGRYGNILLKQNADWTNGNWTESPTDKLTTSASWTNDAKWQDSHFSFDQNLKSFLKHFSSMLHPTWKSLQEAELVLQTSWITFHQHLFSWCPTCSPMDIQSQCRPLWEPTIKDMIHHEASFLPKRSRFTLTLSLPWVSDNFAGIMWNLIWLPVSWNNDRVAPLFLCGLLLAMDIMNSVRKLAPQLREKKAVVIFLQGNPTLLNDSPFAFRWISITSTAFRPRPVGPSPTPSPCHCPSGPLAAGPPARWDMVAMDPKTVTFSLEKIMQN